MEFMTNGITLIRTARYPLAKAKAKTLPRLFKERRSPGRRLKGASPAGKPVQIQSKRRLRSRRIFLTGDLPPYARGYGEPREIAGPWTLSAVIDRRYSALNSQLPTFFSEWEVRCMVYIELHASSAFSFLRGWLVARAFSRDRG